MSLTTRQILTLQQLPGIGVQTILKFGDLSADTLPDDCLEDLVLHGKARTDPKVFARALEQTHHIGELATRQNVRIISYYDDVFPESLRRAVNGKGKAAPSLVLFCRGDISLLSKDAVAVIGTRGCAPEAKNAGRVISEAFAENGFCIVSGLAVGCDAAAHRGALDAPGGQTIAVLGSGVDCITPKVNIPLAQRILGHGGLLLSEYPSGTPATPYRLVARDRLQAALSLATVVVQTKEDGGSMHAAIAAHHAGKPLYTVRFTDPELDSSPAVSGNRLLASLYQAKIIGGYRNASELGKGIAAIATDIRRNTGKISARALPKPSMYF